MHTEYDFLTTTEKSCYQQLLEEIREYKTEFQFGAVTPAQITKAFRALLHDHPEIFWLTGGGEFEQTTVGGKLRSVTLFADLHKGMVMSVVPQMASILDCAVELVVTKAKFKKNTFDQVLAVHDYIIDTTQYDLKNSDCYNAFGCLVQNKAVCAGYTKAFMLVMNRLGYECGYASGFSKKSGEPHGWNYILLDGEYYFIDVTGDDPTSADPKVVSNNKTYDFFCVTTKELEMTHRLSDEFHVPECNGTKYNYYVYNSLLLKRYSFDEVARIAAPQLRANGKFTVKFESVTEAKRAHADLIEKHNVYNIPGVNRKILYSTSRNGLIMTVTNN